MKRDATDARPAPSVRMLPEYPLTVAPDERIDVARARIHGEVTHGAPNNGLQTCFAGVPVAPPPGGASVARVAVCSVSRRISPFPQTRSP